MELTAYHYIYAAIIGIGIASSGYFTWVFRPTSRWHLVSLDVWWLIASLCILFVWAGVRFSLGLVVDPQTFEEAVQALFLGALIDIGLVIRVVRWRKRHVEYDRVGHPLRRQTDATEHRKQ